MVRIKRVSVTLSIANIIVEFTRKVSKYGVGDK